MTRIVAGVAGGRTLQVPRRAPGPRPTACARPCSHGLEHLGAIDDARVLDLYAGSGALGLEAASRGAAHVTLVESARLAADVCRRNVAAVGLGGRVVVAAERVERFVARPTVVGWDLVLLDPPYDVPDDDLAVVLAGLPGALSPDAVVVVERSTRSPEPTWPPGLALLDDRTYGETRMWFAHPADRQPPATLA